MRYFLLFCTILILQVFMPSGRILAAVPVTTQLSATSYAAIQPIEPIKAKKQKLKTKNKKYKAKPTIDSDVWILILIILAFLFVYAILPLGAILGITWLWITVLSVNLATSVAIPLLDMLIYGRDKGLLTAFLGFIHFISFLIVFLVAVFILYNNFLFWILSLLTLGIIAFAVIMAAAA